jgi:hypothetical protein
MSVVCMTGRNVMTAVGSMAGKGYDGDVLSPGEDELEDEATGHDGARVEHGVMGPVGVVQADLVKVPVQSIGDLSDPVKVP